MSFVVQYQPDPRTLGAYSFLSGSAPAVRQNLQRSIDNAQQAAQFNAQQRQHSIDRAASQYDRQQGREAELLQEQMQQSGYALKNQYDLQAEQEQNAARLREQQIQQQGQRAQRYDEMVQAGLKSGELFHTPRMKQEMSEIQRSIGAIYADTSIAPEQQDAMADRLYQRMRGIVPAVRNQEDVPTPFHERAGQDIAVMNEKGQVIPLSQLGRAPKNGEMIVTGTMRNGSMSYKTQPYTNKDEDPYKDFTDPVKLNQRRAEAARDIQTELDVDYANRLAAWNDAKDAHPDDSDTKFTTPRPVRFRPTPAQINAKLYEMSGGVAGAPMPEPQQGSWPRPAMMGGYSPVQIPGQQQQPASSAPQRAPTVQDYGPLPSGTGRMTTPVTRKQDRQIPGAVSAHIESEGLTPYAQREGLTDRDYAVMPSDTFEQMMRSLRGKRDFAIASQTNPVQVKSQEDAKRLPFGTKFILNGRTGTVQ